MEALRAQGVDLILLEYGAPAHVSRITKGYLSVHKIQCLEWPGHSPIVNASEHAWPWIPRHITNEMARTYEAQYRHQ
ncbi:hypothetical protein PSPO01_14986 [Paraphaeosphaeria sporulosa]